jgi:hypothetical protein
MATKKSASKKATKKATKASAPRKAAAPNLSQLQKRLNQDTRLRSQFLKDPGGVLGREGVELTPEKAESLARFTSQVTAPARQVSIESIRQQAGGGLGAKARIEVEVTVRIRF